MDYTELVSNLNNFQNTIDNSITDSDRDAFSYYSELIKKQKEAIEWQTAFINGDTSKTGGYGLQRWNTGPEEYARQEKKLEEMKQELVKKEGWLAKTIRYIVIRNLAPALNYISPLVRKDNPTREEYEKVEAIWNALRSITTVMVNGIDASNATNEEIRKNDQAKGITQYLTYKKPANAQEVVNDTRLNYLQRQTQARTELPGSASQYYKNLAAAGKTKQTNKTTTAFEE